MKRGVRGRLILILATVFLSVLFFLPSTPLYSRLPTWWGTWLPDKGVTMGLDLQGGIHLVLAVQTDKAVDATVQRGMTALKESLEEKKVAVQSIVREGRAISLAFAPEAEETVKELLSEEYSHFKSEAVAPGKRRLSLPEDEVKRIGDASTAQVLETIRNRIDQFGVMEPLIQQQGADQVLVQLPGVKEPQRAMELIGKTALLEFKLLDEEHPVAGQLPDSIEADKADEIVRAYADRIPPSDEILFERLEDKETGRITKRPYLVKKGAVLSGETLSDARVTIGEFNDPYVSITFDSIGAKIFEKVTEANVRRRLAIVLDNTVYSAPTIQEKIGGGRAQISGTYTTEEASDLAIVLRAGALPAPVEIIQNVTVGPSLGHDSIVMGLRAGVIGTVAIALFMVFYYRLSGLLANFAMALNVILLIGALAALNATLTLPGIAGIILTIGMAVDSNVLVFERIRDEIRGGKPVRLAIDAGYDRAFSSILDSHVTTLITSVVLFLFGTGPIKGFAVSLSLGVMINLFTSLVGTRVVFDFINSRKRLERLSI
jgi:preprotein translocase subunit SecD